MSHQPAQLLDPINNKALGCLVLQKDDTGDSSEFNRLCCAV